MQTYIVYVGLLLFAFLCARIAELTNKKRYVIYIIVAFSLVAGLRKSTVGIDTLGYINCIESISIGRLDLAYGLEWSFRYICYGLSFVLKEPQMYLILFAFISNGLIALRLWDFRKHISFSWAITIYYVMFYMMSLNLMRQFVAIAIVFYATRYLSQGKHIKYLLFVLIATLFHQSALIGILYVFFNITAWKYLSKKQKGFFITVGCLSPFVFIYVFISLIQYSDYFKNSSLNMGLMIIIKILFFIVATLIFDKTEFYSCSQETRKELGYIQRTSASAYFVGLLLTALGYVWKIVSRIGLYFYVFEPVYIGMIFKQKNTKKNLIIKMVAIFIFSYQFLNNLTGNGQGQLPYLFCWQ